LPAQIVGEVAEATDPVRPAKTVLAVVASEEIART
jgi:hypothetical protein